MGSGTTAVAAVMEGRDYIGIELNAEYCEAARSRVALAEGHSATTLGKSLGNSATLGNDTRQHSATEVESDRLNSASEEGHSATTLGKSLGNSATLGNGTRQHSATEGLLPRQRVLLEYIQSRVTANGGYPLGLTSAMISDETGLSVRTVGTSRTELRRLGLIVCLDRGAEMLYSLPGGPEATGSTLAAISPSRRVAELPSDLPSDLPSAPGPGIPAGIINSSLNEDINPGLGRDPGTRQLGNAQLRCSYHPLGLQGLTKWPSLVNVARQHADVFRYCWGDDAQTGQACSWVGSANLGEIVPAGLVRKDYQATVALYEEKIRERYLQMPPPDQSRAASVSDPRKRGLEEYRERYGRLPWETPPPEPRPWDETNPHYRPDRPDPVSAWQAALGRLQLEIPHEQFHTFVRPCSGLRWEDDCLVVGATNDFAVSWLELPLHLEMATEAVSKTVGAASRVRYLSMPGTRRDDHEPSA